MVESRPSIENLKVAIEAVTKAREVEREHLENNGLQTCVVHLKISYNPYGDDQFCFYNNNGERIEQWTGEDYGVTFKNEGESQFEVFSRHVKVFLMKDAKQVTKIAFCNVDGKYVTLKDKKSVERWVFYVNTEFILLS